MEKWYQLGGQSSIFWDPKQPKNQTLLVGQVLQLKATDAVSAAVRKGGLTVLSESEAQEFLKKNPVAKEEVVKDDGAQAKLDQASQKEEFAKNTLQEAEIKLAQAKGLETELSELKEDKVKLLERIADLEKDLNAKPDKKKLVDLEKQVADLTAELAKLSPPKP